MRVRSSHPAPDPADHRPDAAVRRVARLHRAADWRVWADHRDDRAPPTVAGDRRSWIPAVYAERGRVRRVVSVATPDGRDAARRRALASAARDWTPHGSYVAVTARSDGAVADSEHVVAPDGVAGTAPLADGTATGGRP